ncbi:MAG TPA: protein kinase, partial [Thermoanaerobaculia bacterium]|nr:protein kinase [Thermoanaerobaculia bacterium]
MQELGLDLSQLDRLLGDVLLEGEIARTSRTAVYRVRRGAAGGDPLARLALKVALQPSDPEDLARFRHEVRLLSEARHPNVIEVFDFGVLPGGYPFLAMELVEGGTLSERLRGRGWDAIYDVAIQAAAGLAHIHRQGVVHMDVKPGNLGIAAGSPGPGEEGFRLKLLDFGLAQEVRGTLDRRIRGTLAYTAPEVLLQDSYDHRADLYSLGMTLFELATGVLPSLEGATDEVNAIRFHLEGELPDPLRFRPDLPAGLARILRRLLARDPADRYPSASRLLVDLSEAAGRPLDAGAAAALSFSEGKVLASRLIGRDDLLGRLRGALGDAARGAGGAILIEGREGVGKSRLLREFRLFASVEGAEVARSQPGGGIAEHGQPLASFLEALRTLEIEVRTPAADAGTPESTEADPKERFRLYQRISRRLARRAAVGAPIVLLLDDLQLAGKQSEELLTYLGEDLRGSRVLVVAAQRPADLEPALAGEDDGSAVQRIALSPLDREATARLVDACLGTQGLPASFYGWIHDASQGLPAEVQQLLRQLMDDQVLQYRDGEWKPSIPALTRWATSAEGLEAQGWKRFAALPAPERETLEAAAVLARPFSLALLGELLGHDSQVVYERLTGLVAQGYLERLQEAGGARYRIARQPFRQALYTSLNPERRIALHRRVAALLEEHRADGQVGSEPGLVTDLAEHFWRGGQRSQSLPYLTLAAAEAIAVYAYAQAAGLYGRAAEAARELGDSATVARALTSQAEALTAAGSSARALKVFDELLQGQEPGDEPGARTFAARTELSKGRLHGRLGEHEAALASHEEGLRQLAGLAGVPDIRQPDLQIDLLHGKALALRDLGDWEAAFAAARSALAEAGGEKLDRQRANLLNTLGSLDYAA